MNRRHFFKLAAALPVVGPAAIKAASAHPGKVIYENLLAEAAKIDSDSFVKSGVFYVIGIDVSEHDLVCGYLGWDRERDGILRINGVSIWETRKIDLTGGSWTVGPLIAGSA